LNGRYFSKADLQKILQRVEESAKKEAQPKPAQGAFN